MGLDCVGGNWFGVYFGYSSGRMVITKVEQKAPNEYGDVNLYARYYVATYHQKIDCADLAIVTLIEFARQENLPVKFKYYKDGWQWLNYALQSDDAQAFKKQAKMMLGALNIIDNTIKVQIQTAKSGGFIMSKWNNSLGHTRVIHSVIPVQNKFKVIWYQGNLPPVRPEKREDFFSNIQSVYEEKPRRWNFEQFND